MSGEIVQFKEEKAGHLERWKASGKSPWIYAEGNGVNSHTFVKWTQGPEGPQGFIEVRSEMGEPVWDDLVIFLCKRYIIGGALSSP
jgi:hypothetical protein